MAFKATKVCRSWVLAENRAFSLKDVNVEEEAPQTAGDEGKKGGWIKKRGESNRERGCKEKKGGESDYEETEAKKKNLETDSRIMRVILGGVKVRTSTFSFFPSVIDLADELL